jgi:hypothetical protein
MISINHMSKSYGSFQFFNAPESERAKAFLAGILKH